MSRGAVGTVAGAPAMPDSHGAPSKAGGVPNINGRVGGGGGHSRAGSRTSDVPLPHIDDLTAGPADLDMNKPINSLVDEGLRCIKTAEAMREWRKPALALREYLNASIIGVEMVPRHKDYPSLKSDRRDIGIKHEQLLAHIRAAHPKFEVIKTMVLADNERSGIQPTKQRRRSHSRANTPNPDNYPLSDGGMRPPSWQNHSKHPPSDSFAGGDGSLSASSTADNTPSSSPSVDALVARFSKLGGPVASGYPAQPPSTPRTQDPRIKTRPIVPLKQSGPRLPPAVPTNNNLPNQATPLPLLPKLPDAIYSPARGTVSSEAAQLPSSTPRGLFSRTPSTTSMAVATPPAYNRNFGSGGYFGNVTSPSAAQPRQPVQLDLDDGVTITPEKLFECRNRGAQILLLDVRHRDQFNLAHISWHAVVCIEPSILERVHVTSDDITSSNVVAPEEEQRWFDKRAEFDLVVLYDENTELLSDRPTTSSQKALLSLYTALDQFSYGKELKHHPRLLQGGIDAWTKMYGRASLAASPVTALQLKPTKRHRSTLRGSVASNYIPKPLKPEEVKKWSQTLENDRPHAEEGDNEDDEMSIDIARTTSQFMQKYPDLHSEKESMTSPVGPVPSTFPYNPSSVPNSGRNQAGPELLWAPTRPAPVMPRPNNSGFSGPPQTHAPVANMATAGPKSLVQQRGDQYTGLNNPNNWCYANSSLQALLAAVPFSTELQDKKWDARYQIPRKADEKIDNPQLMTKIVSNLFYWMGSSQFKVMKAQTLMDYCRHLCHKNPDMEVEFGGSQQQDAQEFTLFLMANLHEETNRHRDRQVPNFVLQENAPAVAEAARFWEHHSQTNQSMITKYFTGAKQNQRTCSNCQHQSYDFEIFNVLLIPIPARKPNAKHISFDECLFRLLTPERLDGYRCDNCKEVGHVLRRSNLARLPELLCISFNRYRIQYNMTTGDTDIERTSEKVCWDFDNISLDAFVMDNIPGPHSYECFAVVVHAGASVTAGHYYAYVRDPHDPLSSTWYLANDSQVTPHGVPRCGSREKDRILQEGDAVPYVLYFRRKRAPVR